MALQQSLQHLKRISKGTNTKYLTLALLNNVSILYPPPEIQYKYEERIDAVKACSISAAKSQAMIHDLHTALQTNAFQGTL
jgi:type I restriction enzyme S subunit